MKEQRKVENQAVRDTDLGRTPVGRLLWKLAVPAILAQIINVLYNIVDRAYIGNIEVIGKTALTGVGVAFPLITLISAFAALIGMGGAPLAAIRMGAGDNKSAGKIMGNAFTALSILGAVLTALVLLFKRELLFAFGASPDTIGYAEQYMTIYAIGTVFVMMTLGMNAFITTQGFARTGMATVLIGAVLNIILDPIFIFALGMDVSGAALATILSQAVSCVWVLCFLRGKKTILRLRRENFRLEKKLLLSMAALGLSPFIMQATESLVQIVLNTGLQQCGGDDAVGAMTIINSVLMIVLMPLQGLGQGAQPIISYNYGAGSMDRVKRAFKLLLLASLGFAGALWASAMLFPGMYIAIFNNDPALVELTAWGMRIFLAAIFVMGAQMAVQQTFLAVGQAKVSIFIAMLRKIILLIPLALILPRAGLGLLGIFLAEPIADVCSAMVASITFAVKSRKLFSPRVPEA